MITLSNPFDWYRGDSLRWPDDDKKLLLVNDWVADVDAVLRHVSGRSVAVQAGGACGIWPARLAGEFAQVITYEPQEENYACLKHNCAPYSNITAYRAGLGREMGNARLQRDAFEDGNAGAWYAVPGDGFPVVPLDGLALSACDLIMLDVEGGELDALLGAVSTIERCRPVVVVEQKQLPHMAISAADAGQWLESVGYRAVAKYHNDVVYAC